MTDNNTSTSGRRSGLRTAGLFAGIAGIELGLERSGHRTEFLNEIWHPAQRVLESHYPDIPLIEDVRDVRSLPDVDLVSAGFPCQDLSQAGRTAGIAGNRSGLVGEVFRLVEPRSAPEWVLLENVPFMLRLDKGQAMHYLTEQLDAMGYAWAYRVIDTRAFGLPQRRRRVVLLASRVHDPREVLFQGSEDPFEAEENSSTTYGFYWTEGLRGVGWGVSCVPTLKGGSSLGIPSPPAMWAPDGSICTPDIRDAERLQGFPVDWTIAAEDDPKTRKGIRWKLVGNAVSVPLSEWVGRRLLDPKPHDSSTESVLQPGESWPTAAWGSHGKAHRVDTTEWPTKTEFSDLSEFLRFPTVPLSRRAAAGFLSRARRSSLRFAPGFLDAIELHLERIDA